MTGDTQRPERRSLRLRDYDYAQAGAYFLTICTHDRACLFGEIADAAMLLNESGRIVETCWRAIPQHFPSVGLDDFVIMPNHLHGILLIEQAPVRAPNNRIEPTPVGARFIAPDSNAPDLANPAAPIETDPSETGAMNRAPTPGAVVRAFKARATKAFGHPVWQRNYYEHVVRSEPALHRIREYIAHNPAQWAMDQENPDNAGPHQ